jgi:N6-adenosine-specific RNA methylase IME4
MMTDNALAKLDQATRMLAEAKTLDEVLNIMDIAEAARAYARAAKLGMEAYNHAAEVKARAERKAGEKLAQLERSKGGDARLFQDGMSASEYREVLDDFDIPTTTAFRWQAVAKMPEREFEQHLEEMRGEKPISTSGMLKVLKEEAREQEISEIKETIETNQFIPPEGLFNVISIDPPWPYGTEYDPNGRRSANPYPEMSLDEIEQLSLPAAEDCILWLWTTHKFMRYAFRILDTWGFRDVAILTWEKDRMGLGSWLRSSSEFCIMAVKGKPIVNLTNQTTVIHGPMREHSRKPDEFYLMVNELCPGYKLDWFSREAREGWAVFGIESEKFNGLE